MSSRKFIIYFLFLISVATIIRAETLTIASDVFIIPTRKPDAIITANTLVVKDGIALLEGNVKAIRGNDILTCNRAILNQSEEWIVATLTPRLYQKVAIVETKVTRESTLDARTIKWNGKSGKFNASDSVNMKIDEKTWDLATHSWVIISADNMLGYRDKEHLIFNGKVKIRDKDHFGRGQRLDYFKKSSTAIITGDAYVETKEWNRKKAKFEKKIITGKKITYNTKTKDVTSE